MSSFETVCYFNARADVDQAALRGAAALLRKLGCLRLELTRETGRDYWTSEFCR